MNWKDLEIGNIPSDFFVNEKYEIECLSTQKGRTLLDTEEFTAKWVTAHFDPSARYQIIGHLSEGTEYRYRLKPLEPIRIPQELLDYILFTMNKNCTPTPRKDITYLESKYGRKVEVIE